MKTVAAQAILQKLRQERVLGRVELVALQGNEEMTESDMIKFFKNCSTEGSSQQTKCHGHIFAPQKILEIN